MSGPVRIICWGNRGRRDDGVALVLAEQLEKRLAPPAVIIDQYHQLGPEIVCDLDGCRLAIFVDADVRPESSTVSIEPVEPAASAGLNTHHCKPSELLTLAASLGFRTPPSLLVCIPARDLDFGDELSETTRQAMLEAEQRIIHIIETTPVNPEPRDCHA